MNRRVYSTRTASAAKWCVALFGIAALPAWSFGQQAAPAKTEPAKAPEVTVTGTINLVDQYLVEQKGAESELQAIKAEMDALNARLKQLQAEKAKQAQEAKERLLQAERAKIANEQKLAIDREREALRTAAEKEKQFAEAIKKREIDLTEAKKAEDQIRAAKDAELRAIEAMKARRAEVEKDPKEAKIEQLKVQLAEVLGQVSKQKADVIADKAARLLTEPKATAAAPPAATGARQVLRSGSQGVKVIGADGKEIPGVIVIIDHPTPAINARINVVPGTNIATGERLVGQATIVPAAPGAPAAPSVTVQGLAITPPHLPPLAPARVEGVRIYTNPVPTAPTAPTPPAAATWQATQPLQAIVTPASPAAGLGTFTAIAQPAQANTITLSRATYKLPKDQAATLSSLLSGLKHVVMETKLENDTLIVTTTPDAQREIAGFVRLITGGGVTFQFSVPLGNAAPAIDFAFPLINPAPATPAAPGAPAKVGSAKVVDIPLKADVKFYSTEDAKPTEAGGEFFMVEDFKATNGNIQKYQLKTGEKGEMILIDLDDNKPKTAGAKNIEIRAKEENGKLTIETVDAVGPKPQMFKIKNEKGETITFSVAGGGDPTKKPTVLNVKKGENGETIIIQGGTIRLENINKVTPPAPAAPAAPAGATSPAKPVAPTAPAAPAKPTEAPKKPAAPATTGEKPK